MTKWDSSQGYNKCDTESGRVAHVYNPSYWGGEDRRTEI
jgi:hypothetical protein